MTSRLSRWWKRPVAKGVRPYPETEWAAIDKEKAGGGASGATEVATTWGAAAGD